MTEVKHLGYWITWDRVKIIVNKVEVMLGIETPKPEKKSVNLYG